MTSLLADSHSMDHLRDVAPGITHLLDQIAMLLRAVQIVLGCSEANIEHVHEASSYWLWSSNLWLNWLLCFLRFWHLLLGSLEEFDWIKVSDRVVLLLLHLLIEPRVYWRRWTGNLSIFRRRRLLYSNWRRRHWLSW